jgi:choline-sulfatase
MNGVEITPEQIRAARRAYYGAISYVDDHIARLLDLLRATGRLDDTVVVLTSDHGEMLGERGLWYKMSFYEGSARVPLVISAPRWFAPRRVSTPVTTMDLLPTLVGLAQDGDLTGVVGPLDGHTLLPLLAGEPADRDTVTAEYLAEGAIAPIVMIRRGNAKLIPLTPPTPTSCSTSHSTRSSAPTWSRTPHLATCSPTSWPRSKSGGTCHDSTGRCGKASSVGSR